MRAKVYVKMFKNAAVNVFRGGVRVAVAVAFRHENSAGVVRRLHRNVDFFFTQFLSAAAV